MKSVVDKDCAPELQPETIIGYFNAYGITVTIEEARLVLPLLYLLADLALDIAECEQTSHKLLPGTKV